MRIQSNQRLNRFCRVSHRRSDEPFAVLTGEENRRIRDIERGDLIEVTVRPSSDLLIQMRHVRS